MGKSVRVCECQGHRSAGTRGSFAGERLPTPRKSGFSASSIDVPRELGHKWHAFYDTRGVRYYFNFETQESMRRPGKAEGSGKSESETQKDNAKVRDLLQKLSDEKSARRLDKFSQVTNEPSKRKIKSKSSKVSV